MTKEGPLLLVQQFCDRSRSEETRRAYSRVVKEFFAFLGEPGFQDVTPDDISKWIARFEKAKLRPSTIAFKLSVIRSFFDFCLDAGHIAANPAANLRVESNSVPYSPRGKSLSGTEVKHLLAGPDRSRPDGARDYALMLLLLRTGLRVAEACSIKASRIKWSHGRWTVRVESGAGRERTLPLPDDLKVAIDSYLKMDNVRRQQLKSAGPEAFVFQPQTNYRTLVFGKPLSPTMVWHIVKKWGEFTGIGKLSPHDLRRTAITRALEQGLTYAQIQLMSGHSDPKGIMRYDRQRQSIELNAINYLSYDETKA